MLKRIIAKIDVKSNNVVKGVNLEGLRVLGKTWDYAKFYYDNQIDELIYQDVVASLYGKNTLYDVIEKTAKNIFIPLTVGGGISNLEEISKILRCGADKVSINTAGLKKPEFIYNASRKFGKSTIVCSLEIKKYNNEYYCYYDNGRNFSNIKALNWIKKVSELGAGELLITFIDSEGTGKGQDIVFLKQIKKIIKIPIISNGGIGTNLQAKEILEKTKISGIAISSMFHYNYLKKIKTKNKELSNYDEGNLDYLNNFYDSNNNFENSSIKNLKNFLIKKKIKVRKIS